MGRKETGGRIQNPEGEKGGPSILFHNRIDSAPAMWFDLVLKKWYFFGQDGRQKILSSY